MRNGRTMELESKSSLLCIVTVGSVQNAMELLFNYRGIIEGFEGENVLNTGDFPTPYTHTHTHPAGYSFCMTSP